MCVCARVCICGCRQQGNTGSKPLHQQNPPSVNWRCRLAQADLYNGRTMSAAIVVHNHIVSTLPCRHLATNSKLESTKLGTQNVTNTLCLYTTPGYLTDRNSSVATLCYYTHTYPFNGPFSGTTWVSRYQKGKTNLDFTGAKDSEWQWHQLGHMQVCTSLQTDNHASTPPLSFYRPDALPAAQPTASKH